LALALIDEEQSEKAGEVLTKVEEILPPSILGYTYLDLATAEGWYRLGEKEKGKACLEGSFNFVSQLMDYYVSLPEKYIQSVGNSIQNNLYELREQMRIASQYGETELSSAIEEKFNAYYSTYLGRIGQGQ